MFDKDQSGCARIIVYTILIIVVAVCIVALGFILGNMASVL